MEKNKKEISKEDISNLTRKIIAKQLGIPEDKIQDNTDLINELGVDSLDTLEIVLAIEEKFCIPIPDDDSERLTTFKQITDYLHKKIVAGDKKTWN